ncbi:hypothetical protein Q3G72_023283 [Acer saccharum]|nr:hypothetical protein Q3G72_023283 [Acer saccharum]
MQNEQLGIKNSRRSMWMGFFAKKMVDLASAENDSASAENDLELYYQLIEGKKGPLRMRVPPSAQIPKRHNPCEKKTETFVEHFESEESEEEEVLCAYINERNSSNNAKKYVKQYGKHLGIDMEGIFRYTYLKKEMVDSTSAGNNLEFYYQLIEASREKLFSDRFLDLDKDDNEWSSLPLDSFSVELGRKRSLRMRVPPSAQIPMRPNPWFGFYDTFLKKN